MSAGAHDESGVSRMTRYRCGLRWRHWPSLPSEECDMWRRIEQYNRLWSCCCCCESSATPQAIMTRCRD